MGSEKTKKKISWREVLAIVLGAAFLFVGTLFIGVKLYFRLPHGSYYAASLQAFEIPGTNDGLVAQGLDYDPVKQQFLISGYMKDGSVSPVYLQSADGKTAKRVKLADTEGVPYEGHCSGLCLSGNRLYITTDKKGGLLVYDYAALCAAEPNATVRATEFVTIATPGEDFLAPDFVTSTDEYLIVGEYYRYDNYLTPESHHITTAAGDAHKALAVIYHINHAASGGIDPTPVAALSLPDLTQGMTVHGDMIYLSNSWALAKSHIGTYSVEKVKSSYQKDITVLGTTMPLYALDSSTRIKDSEIPPMAEELVVVNDRLYVMCESASDKYIFGKFTGGEWCYATELAFFEPKS